MSLLDAWAARSTTVVEGGAESHAGGRVTLYAGDCFATLRAMADNSIDSVCCDPPYALVSVGKRFGGDGAAPAQFGRDGAYQRASAGFMGKKWDTGETAFSALFWAECLRVLKPGGHVAAFGGTRTYHRMACAIEDAGFDIRDQLGWVYGSGFPKSLDISKAIDKRGGNGHLMREIGAAIKAARESRGLSILACDALYCGGTTNWTWFEGRPVGQRAPSPSVFAAVAADWPELRELAEAVDEVERESLGKVKGSRLAVAPGQGEDRPLKNFDLNVAATDAARQWEGWGTALKPAWEPICLARKPLIGTNAENVLAWGTGALNIDGCRVEADDGANRSRPPRTPNEILGGGKGTNLTASEHNSLGRFPANILHDGSDEVLAAFPNSKSTPYVENTPAGALHEGGIKTRSAGGFSDSGSAARFFYCAKANKADRAGSKHPTVKPISLMRWLCRLVTPPGGTVLDPFAGSGTTGQAALEEGFRVVLCEREAEYLEDIRRRLGGAA